MREPIGLHVDEENLSLSTDLYELTMAAGYFVHGREDVAVFELFVRSMPEGRGFLLAAGLEQALHGLLHFRFSERSVEYLNGLSQLAGIPPAFFEMLRRFRFTGDVWGIPEGTVFFENEPLLRVQAPIIEAQLVETFLLTHINFQALIATKAARTVIVSAGRTVVDFGSRRAHGPQAALLAARAAHIGGCAGTSNVLAGRELGIPVVGTAAHSWTMSWPDEDEAFRRYREVFPESSVLLVDTYDTLRGVRRAAATGPGLRGVRLDSGDLLELSKEARRILDESGHKEARIIASGDLDEYRIAELVASGAPIDSFGVGTRLVTSFDEPALGGVYKLVEIAGRPAAKGSAGKATCPGVKQVFRYRDADGKFARDVIAAEDEKLDGEALLSPYVRGGGLVGDYPTLEEIRARAAEELKSLPERLKRIRDPGRYPVGPTSALVKLRDEVLSAAGRH